MSSGIYRAVGKRVASVCLCHIVFITSTLFRLFRLFRSDRASVQTENPPVRISQSATAEIISGTCAPDTWVTILGIPVGF